MKLKTLTTIILRLWCFCDSCHTEKKSEAINMLEHYNKCLKQVETILNICGLCVFSKSREKSVPQFIIKHWVYIIHFVNFNLEVIAQMWWFVDAIQTGKSILEITFLLPCLILCFLSNFKSISFLYYANHINKLNDTMLEWQIHRTKSEEGDVFEKNLYDEHVSTLMNILKKTMQLNVLGPLLFALSPLFIMVSNYLRTGVLKLELPFIAKYPFDEFQTLIYPFVYFHQVMTATQAVMLTYAPDYFFFTCCTFVRMQFILLQYNMERLVNKDSHECDQANFKTLAVHHTKVLRFVNLLEIVMAKSMLFNSLTSSVIICVTGFNVTVVDSIYVLVPFLDFLIFGLMQIFMYCHYGDSIMTSSAEVSDGVYNSEWYNISASERKGFFIIMIRAQRACELTAYGFFPVNLNAFMSILSTSWSYFALLQTMYSPEAAAVSELQ